MDSDGRYLEETIGNISSTSSSFRVLFKPGASTHQYNSIEGVPRRWMGEGSFVIVHFGSNNISNRVGTEKESANIIIKKDSRHMHESKKRVPICNVLINFATMW